MDRKTYYKEVKKTKLWNRLTRIIFGRTMYLLSAIVIQLFVLFSAFRWLSDHVFFVYGGFTLLSTGVVVYILNKRQNTSYQLSWIIPVLVFPVFGALFYLFMEFQTEKTRLAKRLDMLIQETKPFLTQENGVLRRVSMMSRGTAHLAYYMSNHGGYPMYEHTAAEYFPLGDDMFVRLLEELKQAKHYIFMEYFIVERGEMWDAILEILKEKVQEGVEVRVMYDGMCSLTLLPYRYPKELEQYGIQCRMFSPVRPVLSSYQNNRDHRKITVIDGHTAFTGGVNLADEYINCKMRFGHWKDTAIMLKGDAVNSFLMMFLQLWNLESQNTEDYQKYLLKSDFSYPQKLDMRGFAMPYSDSPLDHETVGEYVYLDILNEARHYVHIMTPYLILDSDMLTALTFAAKRGVETIIMMPHIPDKLYAYLLARSYYEELLSAGVQIYEYTPGFLHAKSFVSDDEKAVVGSINLDYRSLHLHFECAVYLYHNPVVEDVEADFQETLKKCEKITWESCQSYSVWKRCIGKVLRLFAPLM